MLIHNNTPFIETCFSPALFNYYAKPDVNVVIIDILRATTAISNAFANGVQSIIPCGTIEEAKKYKEKGYLIAAERDAVTLDFADFGNSPFNFTKENVGGKTVVYSTTNGTQAVQLASKCAGVVIASYLNISTVMNWLIEENKSVVLFCAGWKNKFCIEDTLFAGLLATRLLDTKRFSTICDSTRVSMDIWELAKDDVIAYLEKAHNLHRLKRLNLDDVLEFCHTQDQNTVLPIYKNKKIVDCSSKTSINSKKNKKNRCDSK